MPQWNTVSVILVLSLLNTVALLFVLAFFVLPGCGTRVYLPSQPCTCVVRVPPSVLPQPQYYPPQAYYPPQQPAYPGNQATTSPASSPRITSVTGIVPGLGQPIVISGSGFGNRPPYLGDSPYIAIYDATKGWTAGSTLSPLADSVTLNVTSWTDNQIAISGYSGEYGDPRWTYDIGDEIEIRVWNANTGIGPAVYTMTFGSGSQ